MRRLLRLATLLYPAWWRRRYGREFVALLDDITPGWVELFDVFTGAFTMQMRTLGTIPIVCTFVGAVGGGILAGSTPRLFASSGTIRLSPGESATGASATASDLRASLTRALSESGALNHAATVVVQRGATSTILEVTYRDRDATQAQRVAEQLTTAIASDQTLSAGAAEVLAAPGLPQSPLRPDYTMPLVSGGALGLVLGAVALLLLRSRR